MSLTPCILTLVSMKKEVHGFLKYGALLGGPEIRYQDKKLLYTNKVFSM